MISRGTEDERNTSWNRDARTRAAMTARCSAMTARIATHRDRSRALDASPYKLLVSHEDSHLS